MASRITVDTEKTFRQALYAVVKKDEGLFEAHLDAFADENELIAACARATDIAALVIVEQYQGKPSPDMLHELATHIASFHEEWSGLTAADLDTFLTAMLEGVPVERMLPTDVAVRVPFVLTGHLLVQFQRPDEQWFDYLDRLWEDLEARP